MGKEKRTEQDVLIEAVENGISIADTHTVMKDMTQYCLQGSQMVRNLK
jgi:hypothetical protein